MDILGNERADELAKKGARLSLPPHLRPVYTMAALNKHVKQRRAAAYEDWWNTKCPQAYRRFHPITVSVRTSVGWQRLKQNPALTAVEKCPPELNLPRWILARLLASRTGHGDFSEYHEARHHQPDQYINTCSCGKRKTPEHFFLCPLVERNRAAWPLPDKPRPATKDEFFTAMLFQYPTHFAEFITQTEFFKTICPRYRPSAPVFSQEMLRSHHVKAVRVPSRGSPYQPQRPTTLQQSIFGASPLRENFDPMVHDLMSPPAPGPPVPCPPVSGPLAPGPTAPGPLFTDTPVPGRTTTLVLRTR